MKLTSHRNYRHNGGRLFRRTALWLSLIVLFLPLAGFSQLPAQGSLAFTNARVIVGDGNLIEAATILVEEGRIVSVLRQDGSGSNPEDDPDRVYIDLTGKTVMPALIDAHAHLGYEGHRSWGSENYSRENLIDHLQRYAYYGFSAVFSAGSDPDLLAGEVQQAQQRGEFHGARFLFAAGMAPPGQGPNDQFLAHALAVEQRTGQDILYGVASPQQAQEAVREIAAKNIRVIKIWVDDRGGSQEKLAPPLYRSIVEQARLHDIEVYAHQQFATDMPGLLDAGVSGFLHGRIGVELDGSIALQIAESGAFVIPNLGLGELRREAIGLDPFLQLTVPETATARLGESNQRQIPPLAARAGEEESRVSFEGLLAAGVDIVLGTDAGAVPDHFFGYTGHRELEIFVRLGMTPMEAIVAATSKPAQRLGLTDLGLIEAGYSADLLILDENPVDDIRNTRSINAVYLRGAPMDRAALGAAFVQ